MSTIAADPGSFRDPGGQVYLLNDKIYRTVYASAVEDFDFVESTGLIDALVAKGWLVTSQKCKQSELERLPANPCYVIEHSRLPFISYPYEWPFSALKAAALLHLNIQLEAFKYGVILSDASAFNVQFVGHAPVFIDRLSFVRYREGQFWNGHKQFCEQFLNPLLLRSLFGIAHNAWYRGAQEGIPTSDLRRLLRFRHLLSWNIFTHVVLQSFFQEKLPVHTTEGRHINQNGLHSANYQRLLCRLKSWIQNLEPADSGKTLWKNYSSTNSYAADEVASKKHFVSEFTETIKPQIIWDLGCNTGDYAISALKAGAKYAVGFDFDQGALEIGRTRAIKMNLPLHFLFFDATNPTSSQGWAENERSGLRHRAPADAVIALALIHHIVIARNIPLGKFVDWLIDLAPAGVVEFVPKEDRMVQQLLALRKDIFPDYTEKNFINLIRERARICKIKKISESGRLLIWYQT